MFFDYVFSHQIRDISLLKFKSFVFFCIENQSMIVRIPQQPKVRSFKIPIPVSPIIKRSTPKDPKKIETSKIVVGSLSSTVETRENFSSSTVLNLSLSYFIFSSGKYFWFVMMYISIFCWSILTPQFFICLADTPP